MNKKQTKFYEHYFEFNDIKRACVYAGYKESTGIRLIKNENLEKYLEQKNKNINTSIANSIEIMECLTNIMRGYDSNEADDEKALKPINVREQLKAAELLGKAYAIFSPKTDNQTEQSVTILGSDEIEG